MTSGLIDTSAFSASLRSKAIRRETGELLVARLTGSSQEEDLTEPVNCSGVGRIRHFRRATSEGWPENSLPLDPAAHRLGVARLDTVRAQVFQNAACNWRCWYCFVPFGLLNADEKQGEWLTAGELVKRFGDEADRPSILDLSGGQPDLVPEWIPWTMDALENQGLAESTYLWSDDNLSNDYFWTQLSTEQIDRIAAYQNYGKVGCFKGFDHSSFSSNTRAKPELFEQQFDLFRRSVEIGLDVYGYATFTADTDAGIAEKMQEFVERLQSISKSLPLRVIPLQVGLFNPVKKETAARRITAAHEKSLEIQEHAIACWQNVSAVTSKCTTHGHFKVHHPLGLN